MKPDKKNKNNDAGNSSLKKLDSLIEQSKIENEALRKILQGLEKITKNSADDLHRKMKNSKKK